MMLVGYPNYIMLRVLVMCVWYTSILVSSSFFSQKQSDDINLHVMSIYGVILYVGLLGFHIIVLYPILVYHFPD